MDGPQADLGIDVGHFLSVLDEDPEWDGRLDDERQDGDEREDKHLEELDPSSLLVGRVVGALGTALPALPRERNIVRTRAPNRASFHDWKIKR